MTRVIFTKNRSLKKLIYKVIAFGIISIVVGILYNVISPSGIPLITPIKQISIENKIILIPQFKSKIKTNSDVEIINIKPIDIIETEKLFFATGNIFLDARNESEFIVGHIPGAINIPVNEIDIYSIDFLQFESDQIFICYCNNESCDLAMQLAVWLEENGFKNIYYFYDGWDAWKISGNQISRGKNQ